MSFLRYSMSKNIVTLKSQSSQSRSLKVVPFDTLDMVTENTIAWEVLPIGALSRRELNMIKLADRLRCWRGDASSDISSTAGVQLGKQKARTAYVLVTPAEVLYCTSHRYVWVSTRASAAAARQMAMSSDFSKRKTTYILSDQLNLCKVRITIAYHTPTSSV